MENTPLEQVKDIVNQILEDEEFEGETAEEILEELISLLDCCDLCGTRTI